MEIIVELIAKSISFISRILFNRGGETWPGEIALHLDPNIGHKLEKIFDQVIYIIGTNGKTSTSRLLTQVLRDVGKDVITNPTGANQLNGVISSVLIQKKLLGHFKYIGVFEVDENAFPALAKIFSPTLVIILNLLRDQMDRYGEVNSIIAHWRNILDSSRKTTVIANAHDPGVYQLVSSLTTTEGRLYYGVPKAYLQKEVKVSGDFVYCPVCGSKFAYKGRYVSHIGVWFCPTCQFKPQNVFTYPGKLLRDLEQLPSYFVINSQAIYLAAGKLLISSERVVKSLLNWEPAFGRGEKVQVHNKSYFFFLGKNPSSWTVVFESLPKSFTKDMALVLGLNNRIPDGHDVSWIWDVEINSKFKIQNLKLYVYGDRAYDMAERLKIEEAPVPEIELNISKLVEKLKATKEKNIFIIANYSALLEIRKEITGKAIL